MLQCGADLNGSAFHSLDLGNWYVYWQSAIWAQFMLASLIGTVYSHTAQHSFQYRIGGTESATHAQRELPTSGAPNGSLPVPETICNDRLQTAKQQEHSRTYMSLMHPLAMAPFAIPLEIKSLDVTTCPTTP